jgi:hypothetical protein
MERRTFLKLAGALAVPIFGCEAETEPLIEREPLRADAGFMDGGEVDAGFVLTVRESFGVVLNDTSCSGHSHWLLVEAGDYSGGSPVSYLGGSHEVVFTPSELAMLERGERIPFATIGDGPGHGHCGTAWRESVGDADPNLPNACQVRGTAMCMLE